MTEISGAMPPLPILGHDGFRERIRLQIANGALPASILLHGPQGVGKQRLALWMAQALVCAAPPGPCNECFQCRAAASWRHPDIRWVFPRPRLKDAAASPEDVWEDLAEGVADRLGEGRKEAGWGLYPPAPGNEGIFVATVRAIVREMATRPGVAARRVLIVGDAERMVPQEGSEQAANAFLKVLEEPPPAATIILTSSEPGALLPTIRSRVVAFRIAPLRESEVRAFVAHQAVRARLVADGIPDEPDAMVAYAGGAPGALLAAAARVKASGAARELLQAASEGPAARFRVALRQGASGARGAFTDTLEALTDELAGRVRRDAVSDPRRADAAARAVMAVEEAKERAMGNATPQLVAHHLLGLLAEAAR